MEPDTRPLVAGDTISLSSSRSADIDLRKQNDSELDRKGDLTARGDSVRRKERRFWIKASIIIISVLMIAVFLFCVLSGYYSCTKWEVLLVLAHGILDGVIWVLELPCLLFPDLAYTIGNPIPVTWSPNIDLVVWDVRVIRIVAVIFIGGGLALSGASYQCLFRNPLVSESILGVSNGACFGACLAILLMLPTFFINVLAFIGGGLAVFLTYTCSKMLRGNQTLLLVLTGTVVSSIFSAGISIIKYVAPTETALPEITFWLMGSFAKITKGDLLYLIPIITICAVILIRMRWKMNVLALGDREARALGVSVGKTRAIIVVCSTLIASVSVCVCGAIAWVGIIIPQIVRHMVGPDCRRLMPCAFFIGGIFLMLVDVACRATIAAELPVGVVTSLIGAPMFFMILFRAKTAWA
ncbi:iron ABC transporter permease [Adlercreutzia sp. ZJ473]|uniref:FecCD family ABC transporter permease n=1 Tax=Adlercreutzia sp. ZJ473 TaxID=2722822 RepID=UPI001557C305|nr:iron ABC transporter permease [Adlercreutzia sp. ZJ473]